MKPAWRWSAAAVVLSLCFVYALVRSRGDDSWMPGGKPERRGSDAGDEGLPPQAHGAASALRCTPENLDFGEVSVGENRAKSFLLENPGTRDVTITHIQVKCDCLKEEMPARKIPAGGRGELRFVFTGTSGSRWTETRPVLVTDEPGNPRIPLVVRGKSMEVFRLEPATLPFERLARGESKTLETTLRRIDGAPFTVREIGIPRAEFTPQWRSVEEGRACRISVKATGMNPGVNAAMAQVFTDPSPIASATFVASLEVPSDFSLEPALVEAGVGSDREIGVFETKLRRSTPGPVIVKAVDESDDLPIQFSVERAGEGVVRLRIRIQGPYPSRPPLGQFLVYVDAEEQPLLLRYRIDWGAPLNR